MKNTILFLIVYSLISSYIAASEQPGKLSLIELPQGMIQHKVNYASPKNNYDDTALTVYHLNIPDVAALKQTCKQWNKNIDYFMVNSEIVEKIEEMTCTKWLYSIARMTQKKNFSHFFSHNNVEQRKDALKLLGWSDNLDNVQLMQVYCTGINAKVQPDWNTIFNTKIALTMICLSNNPNTASHYGNTALICASSNGRKEIVELLLANPAIDINIKNNNGNTALIYASWKGYKEIVKLLLAKPAIDINIKNNNGNTALIRASSNGHTDIVELLLANQAIDINTKSNHGDTALMQASWMGDKEIVELLLANPTIDINMKNNHGNTALIYASWKGRKEIVELLLANPTIDIDAKDTALMWTSISRLIMPTALLVCLIMFRR